MEPLAFPACMRPSCHDLSTSQFEALIQSNSRCHKIVHEPGEPGQAFSVRVAIARRLCIFRAAKRLRRAKASLVSFNMSAKAGLWVWCVQWNMIFHTSATQLKSMAAESCAHGWGHVSILSCCSLEQAALHVFMHPELCCMHHTHYRGADRR